MEGRRGRAKGGGGGDPSPFHEGEQRIQEALGVRESIEPWARQVVRDHLPDQHREFYAALPHLLVGARDRAGRPWATLLAGAPGFVRAQTAREITIDAEPSSGDPLAGSLVPGSDIGFLGIDLATRRRNRMNGQVLRRDRSGIAVSVEQAFGNCPQHIREREVRLLDDAPSAEPGRWHTGLTASLRAWIEGADTFFIATGHRGEGKSAAFGMDVSHRGGPAGFARVEQGRIVFPDYAGNNHFNTIGNLALDPRAGLLFLDFERGDLLHLTGRAEVLDDRAVVERFPGAERVVSFAIEAAVERRGALPLRWQRVHEMRAVRVVDKRRESADVVSFVLAPVDGAPAAPHRAGQYLPIEVAPAAASAPVERTYSISSAPGSDVYRISVKRESHGLVSRALHDEVEVGDTLRASAPQGDFILDAESPRPIVLVGAGVGVTPLVSMLHEITAARSRRVLFVHGVRDGTTHPLAGEARAAVDGVEDARVHVAYSRPRPADREGVDYQSTGRIDAALLEKLTPGLEADFYLCGPGGFLAGLRDGLEARGVPRDRIHAESFGGRR